MLADRAYSTYEIIESLKAKGRNKIERFFHSLKNSRRIATRYDKLDNTFLSFIYFHSVLFWLN